LDFKHDFESAELLLLLLLLMLHLTVMVRDLIAKIELVPSAPMTTILPSALAR